MLCVKPPAKAVAPVCRRLSANSVDKTVEIRPSVLFYKVSQEVVKK